MKTDTQTALDDAFKKLDVSKAISILHRAQGMRSLDEDETIALALLHLYPASYDPRASMMILKQAQQRIPLTTALWGGYVFIADWAGDEFFVDELDAQSNSAEAQYLLSAVLSINGEEEDANSRAIESLKLRRFPRNLINRAIIDSTLSREHVHRLYREALSLIQIAGPELGYDSLREFVRVKFDEFILGLLMGKSEYEHHAGKLSIAGES